MIKKEWEESLIVVNMFVVNDVVCTSDEIEGEGLESVTEGGEF